jgi:signal transduction histidine kinase
MEAMRLSWFLGFAGAQTSQGREGRVVEKKAVIAQLLALAFGTLCAAAIVLSILMMRLIGQVSHMVTAMQADEAAIKGSLELAAAVREQTIQQGRWLLSQQAGTLLEYERWVRQIEQGVEGLRGIIAVADRPRLDQIASASNALDQLFRNRLMPALRAESREEMAWLLAESQHLSELATSHADAVALGAERHMAHYHSGATAAARVGMQTATVGIFLIVLMAAGFLYFLRRLMVRPLAVLTQAAHRFGSGEFTHRVGAIGTGELAAVAAAFDGMAEELVARQARLIQSERMAAIGQLAAGVAHEINNPIQVIRGYLKTMDPGDDPATLKSELRILDEEAAQCQRIAEDLVTYSRSLDLRKERQDIVELIQEVVTRFGETEEGLGRTCVLDAQACRLFFDGGRIRQVLLNLLQNAAHVAPPGSDILLQVRPEGAGCVVSVSDRGPGVAIEDRHRIFEPFFSRRQGGSGLGLAICQGIIDVHGGSIEVEDAWGGGARFIFRLPGTP